MSFGEASTAFGDPLSITIPDPDHSLTEARYLLIGLTDRQHLVVVAHTEQADEIRLINARLAAPRERQAYEEEQ